MVVSVNKGGDNEEQGQLGWCLWWCKLGVAAAAEVMVKGNDGDGVAL